MSAVGALISSLPRNQRLTPDDLLLSIDSLSRSYPLSLVLAALFSNSSIALNSVAGEGVDFALSTVGISPTAIVASSRTMSEYHKKFMEPHTGIVSKIGRWFQARSLDAGTMPSSNLLTKIANIGPTAELTLDKLRLLFISHRADAPGEYRLSSEQLADLRIFTGARVVYALTGPGVAGAVAQTNVFDYRRQGGLSHFGSPLSSVEVTLKGHPEDAGLERAVEGQVWILFLTSSDLLKLILTEPFRLLLPAPQSCLERRLCQRPDFSEKTTRCTCVHKAIAVLCCLA